MPIPTTESALDVFLILLPGFVTLIVERGLAYQREEAGIVIIAKALVYSFMNYVLFYALASVWKLTNIDVGALIFLKEKMVQHTLKVLILLVSSVVLGLIIARLKMTDCHMECARHIGFTQRTSRSSIWIDIFQDYYVRKIKESKPTEHGAFVTVHLAGGKKVHGWPEYYADHFSEGPVLFLIKAKWIEDANKEIPIPDPGILIFGSEIKYIEYKKI